MSDVVVASIKAPDELGPLVGSPGETLTATLKRTITEMILFGFFARDARLYPHELAQRFGVSQTPVREALMQLASEGLIEATPRRGFHIKTPTAEHVAEVWQVRLGLEQTAAEAVVQRLRTGMLDAAAVERLAAIQAQRDALGAAMSTKAHIETNAAFHRALVELSGNRVLIGMFGSIQMQLIGAWVQRGVDSWRGRLAEDAREHHAIISALRAGDAESCRQAMARHVGRSLDGALDDLARQRAEDGRTTIRPAKLTSEGETP
ncbi:MAG: GntR family transcriptional regulator [Alphaproteobacteria bacterium]|nr:GntR family transcriptional regulator [Alphaproteobacteria bacterium]